MQNAIRANEKAVAFSVVIPVYNEQDNLRELNDRLCSVMRSLNKDFEILYVDDGSSDKSREVLHGLQLLEKSIRIIHFKRNAGQSAALAAGFAAAQGDIVIMMDADLQNAPEDIPLLLNNVHGYDMVCGWRYQRQDTWVRKMSSRIANAVRQKSTHDYIHDTGCSLKILRRHCLPRIKMYKGMHRFLSTLFKIEGFKVKEVQVSHFPRVKGISKYGIHNRLWKGLYDLIAIRWMMARKVDYEIESIDG